jgi:hypothetical protein
MWQCTIKIPEKVSLNKIYAGIHFKERQRHKDAYFYVVKEAKPQPYAGALPVQAHYHFKVKGSKLDISNHAYMLKMTEDALVAAGVLPGDEQKYVSKVTITGEQIKTGCDEVTVTLEPML